MKYLQVFLIVLLIPFCESCSKKRADGEIVSESKGRKGYRPVVMVDPGHGGRDFGTYSRTKPRLHEKNFALTTSRMVEEKLRRLGFRTYMTRNTDVFVPLLKRVEMAEKLGADMFVSVHYNSAPSNSAHGVEVFYYKSGKEPERMKFSKDLASNVLGEIVSKTGARSRGVKHGNFAVVREAHSPAILVEGGFLTNPAELQKIRDDDYLEKIADGIARGVFRYWQANGKAKKGG